MENYVGGPTGVDNEFVDGMFFDDNWNSGPSEEEPHSIEDCGLTTDDLAKMKAEWRLTMTAAHHRIMSAKAFDWQLMNCNDYPRDGNTACGGATVGAPGLSSVNPQAQCATWMRTHCGGKSPVICLCFRGLLLTDRVVMTANAPFQKMALMMGFTRASEASQLTKNGSLPFFVQDLATFLLVRGEYVLYAGNPPVACGLQRAT